MSDPTTELDQAADLTLALMALTVHDEIESPDGPVARTWKGYDWAVLDRLHERGDIGNPVSKAKSVVLTPEGLRRCRALYEQHIKTGAPPARGAS